MYYVATYDTKSTSCNNESLALRMVEHIEEYYDGDKKKAHVF